VIRWFNRSFHCLRSFNNRRCRRRRNDLRGYVIYNFLTSLLCLHAALKAVRKVTFPANRYCLELGFYSRRVSASIVRAAVNWSSYLCAIVISFTSHAGLVCR
jgi:hypothetical protein